MSVVAGHIDACLKHEYAEWDARDPGDEAENSEGGEYEKDDSRRVLFAVEVVEGCAEAHKDVQNASGPNELLCKEAGQKEVAP